MISIRRINKSIGRLMPVGVLALIMGCGQSKKKSDNPITPPIPHVIPGVTIMPDTSVSINDTVVVHAAAVDGDGTIAMFIWTVDGIPVDTTPNPYFEHSFSDSGTYRVAVKAIDDIDSASKPDTCSISVRLDPPSAVAFDSAYTVDLNDSIMLSASVYDKNGEVTLLLWRTDGATLPDTTSATSRNFAFSDSGVHHVYIWAVDDDLVSSAPDTFVVTVTAEYPVVTMDADSATPDIYDSVTITAQATDNGSVIGYLWALRGGVYTDTTSGAAIKTAFTDAGTRRVFVRALDNDGLLSRPDSMVVAVTSGLPAVHAMDDVAIRRGDTLRLEATAEDNGSIRHFVWAKDGVNYRDTTESGAEAVVFQASGSFTVLVKAIDDDGLVSAADTVRIIVRGIPPEVAVMPDTAIDINDSLMITGTVSGDSAGIRFVWALDGSTFSDTTSGFSMRLHLPDPGIRTVVVKALDADEQESNLDTVRINVIAHYPSVTAMNDTSVNILDSLTLTASAVDNGAITGFRWFGLDDTAAIITAEGRFKLVFSDSGNIVIAVCAVDDDGLVSVPDSIRIHVGADRPTVTVMNDTAVTINDSITITASGIDNGIISRYVWYFGSTADSVVSTAPVLRTAFPAPGTMRIIVTCIDDDSRIALPDTCTIVVRADAPIVTQLPDTMVRQNAVAAISASAADRNSDGSVEMFYWDLGADGVDIDSTAAGNRIFTNAAGGWLSVAWWVRDDDDQIAADTFRILFNRPPGTPVISPATSVAPLHTYLRGSNRGTVRMRFPSVDPDGASEPLTYTLSCGVGSGALAQVYSGAIAAAIINDLQPGVTCFWHLSVRDLFGDSAVATGSFLPAQPGAGMALLETEGVSFTFGSQLGAVDEQPVSTVRFSSNRWIDTTEVTQGVYTSLMSGYAGYSSPDWSAYGLGANIPAYNITWFDAVLFCNTRSKNDGLDTVYSYQTITGIPGNGSVLGELTVDYAADGYRLPTEAEWEFACRASTPGEYSWGSGAADLFAWFADNSGGLIHAVAQKMANGLGLYDMCGNVAEYCGDWYGAYGSTGKTEPAGPDEGSLKVVRGGDWSKQSTYLKSATRSYADPSIAGNVGFRLVRRVRD